MSSGTVIARFTGTNGGSSVHQLATGTYNFNGNTTGHGVAHTKDHVPLTIGAAGDFVVATAGKHLVNWSISNTPSVLLKVS